MTLNSNSPHNVYRGEETVEFTCEYSGVTQRNPRITFQVLDITASDGLSETTRREGVIVAEHTVQGGETSEPTPGPMGTPAGEANGNGYSGSVSWQPPIERRGCYMLRVTMLGEDDDESPLHERTTMFAMVPSANTPVEANSAGRSLRATIRWSWPSWSTCWAKWA